MMAMMFRTVVAGLALVFLAGCAHQIPATPHRMAIPMPAHKTPLKVGIYFSSAFENYQYSESKWGDTWVYPNLGRASTYQFRDALEENFIKVVKLSHPPSKLQSDEYALDFILAPEIQAYSFDIPFTKFQIYPATITYKINIYEGGTLLASPVVHGVGDTTGTPGPSFSENPSRSASKAIEEGVNKAITAIAGTPQVKSLAMRRTQDVDLREGRATPVP